MTIPRGLDTIGGELAYIQIDYAASAEDPARIFRAMAKLIDAFHAIDRDLVHSVSAALEPVIVLERVEAGSLRAWLRTGLRQVHDDALLNLDVRPLLGQYLVRGKHALLRWLDAKEDIRDRSELADLQRQLTRLTPPSSPNLILIEPVSHVRLLEDIRLLTEATEELRDDETVTYVADGETTVLDTDLRVTSEEVETLLTEEVTTSESRHRLLIKKPALLGSSRWEFHFDDHAIEAKLLDEAWLTRFRAGKIPLRPGDALDATVRAELYRGFEGNIIGTRYFVTRVHGVVHDAIDEQGDLLR